MRTLVYRARREHDCLPVILKVMKREYPTPDEIAQYRREYDITRHLNIDGITQPLGIEKYENRLMIVYEDFGGQSLRALARQSSMPEGTPLNSSEEGKIFISPFFGEVSGKSLKDCLAIFAKVAEILENIHKSGIIHKDINPSNILYNPDTSDIRIIDFGISSFASSVDKLDAVEGTLTYISPEQTGRINRSIDYRSDFYSLGAAMYELLSGKPPFEASDMMELIHFHIAKQPVPLCEQNPEVPVPVSDIVMKLLAKSPEDRYQSGIGIYEDIMTCYNQLENTGKISEFSIGLHDVVGRFRITQRLLQRQSEIETLFQAYASVETGKQEAILISGGAGIGKSALIQEFYRNISRSAQEKKYQNPPYLIQGRFDPGCVPYSALIGAFSELVRHLLGSSEVILNRWRDRLSESLGPNVRLMIDIMPELELITGEKPRVPELSPDEAQNRFDVTFRHFIQIFTHKEHPLVLIIEDLQWADSASLRVIRRLLKAGDKSLFFIGSYRRESEAVNQDIAKIRNAGVSVQEIELLPLDLYNAAEFVAETLNCPIEKVVSLADQIISKTGGNPFFMGEFLKMLYDKKLIIFDNALREWKWNPAEIDSQRMTDNIVELMAQQFQNLDPDIQDILQVSACIGNPFDADILAMVCEKPAETIHALLHKAAAQGFVKLQTSLFSFTHDRIRQAASLLMSEERILSTHYRTGRIILEHTPQEMRDQKLFDIVNHLNAASELIVSIDERNELSRLNLEAGKKAKSAGAYEHALNYLNAGIRLFDWNHNYDLALNLHIEAAETAYLFTDYDQMDHFIEEILSHGKTLLDIEKAYEVKLRALMAQNKMMEAVQLALKVLKKLGMSLPENPSKLHILIEFIRTRLSLFGKTIESLIHLPNMTDPYKLAVTRILAIVGHAAYIAVPNLMPIIVVKIVSMSVKYGNTSFTAYSYAAYGLILCAFFNQVSRGYRFGGSSLMLIERSASREYECRTMNMYNTFVRHWKEHARETLKPLSDAYRIGLQTGDLEYAAISAFVFAGYSFWTGRSLNAIEEEIQAHIIEIRQLRQETPLHWYEMVWQACLNLMGNSEDPCRLAGSAYNEDNMLHIHIETSERVGVCYLHFIKLFLCLVFGKYRDAAENAFIAEKYMEGQLGTMTVPLFHCYDSLARLGFYDECSKSERRRILKRVAKNQKKLKRFADNSPMNHLHKWYLVEAELERIRGNDFKAADYYKQAIRFSREHRYLQDEAIANERVAKFYLARGDDKVARVYLRESHHAYLRWGAFAKTADLENDHSYLKDTCLTEDRPEMVTSTISLTTTGKRRTFPMDLSTVVKSSQAISGEIVLKTLLEKMMKIVLENAGARRGFLLLEKAGKLMIEASGDVETLPSAPLSSELSPISFSKRGGLEGEFGGEFPESIINFVAHTRESVVLSDACQGRFANDPYMIANKPRSVMCISLVNQGKLTGVLYLENNLTTGAFTPDRVEILNMLSSQMAISIENARLYQNLQEAAEKLEEYNRTLEQKVAERTTELNQKNVELNNALNEVEEYNRKITSSIEYARRIQSSLLPDTDQIRVYLPDSFIIWMPRDIVGGDFIFAHAAENNLIIALIDCTGHGVPGAFMTMIASAGLNRIIKDEKCYEPAEILQRLNRFVKTTLGQDTEHGESDDGMDAAVCLIKDRKHLIFSGAKLGLYYVKDGELSVVSADRQSIGYRRSKLDFNFTSHNITLTKEISIYLATDGFIDQFGKDEKPLGSRRFKEILNKNSGLPFEKRDKALIYDFEKYRDGVERQDDVTVIGFRGIKDE